MEHLKTKKLQAHGSVLISKEFNNESVVLDIFYIKIELYESAKNWNSILFEKLGV